MSEEKPTSKCPACGDQMKLARTASKLGLFPELFGFRCTGCDQIVTIEDDGSAGGRYELVDDDAHTYESIKPLITAVETVCRSLNVKSKDDPLAEGIALMVVEAAKMGERDPDRLRDLVLRALRNA
jgi:hypothetical protein